MDSVEGQVVPAEAAQAGLEMARAARMAVVVRRLLTVFLEDNLPHLVVLVVAVEMVQQTQKVAEVEAATPEVAVATAATMTVAVEEAPLIPVPTKPILAESTKTTVG